MAWKVYGAIPGGDYSRAAGGTVYGPLPCKRWEPAPTDGKYKVRHVVTDGTRPTSGKDATDSYNERRAVEYARWLASRDGIDIPATATARVVWSGFYSATRTRNVHHCCGTKPQAVYNRRIEAVEFGRKFETDHYSTRKDGRRGAFTHRSYEMDVAARIEIPNWDWEPAEPIETVEPEQVTWLQAAE